jgi:hypothetical protein
LFLTVWDIYGATFKDLLPPVKSSQSGDDQDAKTIPEDQPISSRDD